MIMESVQLDVISKHLEICVVNHAILPVPMIIVIDRVATVLNVARYTQTNYVELQVRAFVTIIYFSIDEIFI